ncbi:MAG: OB-fold domain-containing protein [Actinobacteria bacterium]|nr:OB-fold domain-containing protein [Actinomycetota bacterium]
MNPAVEGWFSDRPEPHLIGLRCGTCGSYSFPPGRASCPNPACGAEDLEEVALSRRGRLWSWTINRYAPPPPYVAAEPFAPFAVAAVELAEERMVVLGQVVDVAEELALGDEMELVIDALHGGDEGPSHVWKWRRT